MIRKFSEAHFTVLGVTRLSNKEDIRKAYIREIKKWHPDKFPNEPIKALEALEKAKVINEAFELLKNYAPEITKKDTVFSANGGRPSQSANHSSTPKSNRVNVTRYRVRSSNVVSIGYHKLLHILQVEYRGGSLYQYYQVPEILFIQLMRAESKGRFINRNILFKYRYNAV